MYSGGNDSLDQKQHIFYGPCRKARVPPISEIYGVAFSTMLKGDALDFYYDSINGRELSLESMIAAM